MKRLIVTAVLLATLAAPRVQADNRRMWVGALVGAGSGWVLSRNVDHIRPAIAIPALALAGGLIGNHYDNRSDSRKVRERRAHVHVRQAAALPVTDLHPGVDLIKVSIQHRNGTRTDVPILRIGERYVGPQGETYEQLPSAAALAGKYGM